MASAWKLPCIFLCENNKFGVSVCIDRVCNVENLADRAKAYNIPGIIVDGNDVFAVFEAVKGAAERARKGDGPSLIEAKTYRHRGHYEGDPQVYKSPEEIEKWKKLDPINRLRAEIVVDKMATAVDMDVVEAEIKAEIERRLKLLEPKGVCEAVSLSGS